jgi:hypothetical protein
MKFLFVALVLAFQVVQQQTEPEPYPPGWHCTPQGDVRNGQQTREHPCACKKMDHDVDCEGTPNEDPVCKQWCHKNHCGCPIACDGKGH